MTSSVEGHLSKAIFESLHNVDAIREHLPMLLSRGIPDVGETIHSHFLTYIAAIGRDLGFSAVAECPLYWLSGDAQFSAIQPDSVWFDRNTFAPRVLVEFERFEARTEAKLRSKVENLAIASRGATELSLVLLVYWVESGTAPRSLETVLAGYYEGFSRGVHWIEPSRVPLMVIKCVMRRQPGGHNFLFGEFLPDSAYERLRNGRT